jgi:hypothetical protein
MRLRLAVLALALLLAGACDSTDPQEDLHGIYTLRTVSGSTLPFTLQDDEFDKVEVLGGEIRLLANGTFSEAIQYRLTAPGGVPRPFTDGFTGTFTRQTNELTLSPAAGQGQEPYVVEIAADRSLTLVLGQHALIYRK